MLYTAMIFGEPGLFDRLPEADQKVFMQKHHDLQASLKEQGVYRGSIRLMPPSTAMQVTEKTDAPLVLDGPFAETKEQILGLYVYEAEDMEAALAIAQKLPMEFNTMEVRPIAWGEFVSES